jgi:uncharacterized protein YheU (UPF0270 family)
MIIPADKLSLEALQGIIDEFVTREGTDYGHVEPNLEAKCAQVRRQLESGEVVIVFDADDQTCNLVRRHDLPAELLAPASADR